MNTSKSTEEIVIEEMTKEELASVVQWAADEGWNPGKFDADIFFETDKKGFFTAKTGGKLAGAVSAIAYDDNFGFIGFFIVKPTFRHLGIGLKLGQHALSRLQNRNIGVDGVITQVENYKRSGLKIAYKNVRYKFFRPKNISTTVKLCRPKDVNFGDISIFDRKFFPSKRETFLKHWFDMTSSSTFIKHERNGITGFGTIRSAFEGKRIGPLFADSVGVAEEILSTLIAEAKNDEPIFIDIPEVNICAKKLIESYKMEKVFETARMYTKNEPDIFINGIFGVTSYELG